jgi:hypothetical protein
LCVRAKEAEAARAPDWRIPPPKSFRKCFAYRKKKMTKSTIDQEDGGGKEKKGTNLLDES